MSYNNKQNYLTKNILSDEWYTPKFLVEKCLSIVSLDKKTIICPYDTENSIFVKELKNNHNVIYGINDFLEGVYNYDILITNPPFSLKEKIFEKCLCNRKDFILVLPETFIFSVGFYNLLVKYNFHYKMFCPKQRVYFIEQNGNQNRPNFHTIFIYVSNNLKENTIEHFYSETK